MSMVRFNNLLRLVRLAKKATGVVTVVLLAIVVVVLSTPRYAPVQAGWLDKIFGDFKPRAKKRYSRRTIKNPIKIRRSHRSRHIRSIGRIDKARLKVKRSKRSKRSKRRGGKIPLSKARRSAGGTYRTMCVRTCDGFYFPVSFTTTKGRMKKDANICASRCGAAPARLYYYSNPGADIKDMVSYRGNQKYQKLKNAFLFTKKFVADCRCKPEPWTKEAKSQHKTYALLKVKSLRKMASRKIRSKRRLSRRSRARRKKARRRYSRLSARHVRTTRRVRRIGKKRRLRKYKVPRRRR